MFGVALRPQRQEGLGLLAGWTGSRGPRATLSFTQLLSCVCVCGGGVETCVCVEVGGRNVCVCARHSVSLSVSATDGDGCGRSSKQRVCDCDHDAGNRNDGVCA